MNSYNHITHVLLHFVIIVAFCHKLEVDGRRTSKPNRWFSRYVIAAMLVDSKQKVAL